MKLLVALILVYFSLLTSSLPLSVSESYVLEVLPELSKEWQSLADDVKLLYKEEVSRFIQNKARLKSSPLIKNETEQIAEQPLQDYWQPYSKGKVSGALLRRLKEIKETFDHQDKLLSKLENEIEHSLFKTRRTEKKITIENAANFKVPINSRNVEGVGVSDTTIESFKHSFNTLERTVHILRISLKAAQNRLKDVVPKTGTKKLIKGIKYFYGKKTVIEDMVTSYSNIGKISSDDASIDDTIQNLVRINDKQQIIGRKKLTGEITAHELRTSTLNGKNTSYYMDADESSKIRRGIYANGISVQNDVTMKPNSLVDGIDLSEDILRHDGRLKLGSCHFKTLNAYAGIKISEGRINKGSFDDFLESLFKVEKNVSMYGPVQFNNLIIRKNLEAQSIMGVDSKRLLSDLALKSSPNKLQNLQFNSDVKCTDINLIKINNEKFPDEFVMEKHDWIYFGSKVFDSIHFNKLTVGGYVDNVNTTNLVTKTTSQHIDGVKKFKKDLKIIGNLDITSNLLDAVNVESLFKKSDSNNHKNIVIFKKKVTANNVKVSGRVNKVKIENVAKDLIYKGEENTFIKGKTKFFKNLIVYNNVTTTSINDIEINQLVNTKERNRLEGKKIFTKPFILNNLQVDGTIDNINFTDMIQNSLFLNTPDQVVTGSKYFTKFSSQHMNINGSINWNKVNNLLTVSTNQEFEADLLVQKAEFNTLLAETVNIGRDGLINGQSLKDIYRNSNDNYEFDKHLIIDGNIRLNYVATDRINMQKLSDLQDRLTTYDLKHIRNNIVFDKLTVDHAITTSESFGNTAKLKEKFRNALKTNSTNIVKNIEWDEVIARNIVGPQLVNSLNLKKVEADSVYSDDPSTFSFKGSKHFTNGFEVDGDVATTNVNGRNLENLLSKTTRQDVPHQVTFENLRTENVYMKRFNSHRVRDIINTARKRQNAVTTLRGPIQINGNVHVSNMDVIGKFGVVPMKTIMEEAVEIPLRNEKIVITGRKTFTNVLQLNDANVATLNGYADIRGRREEVLRNEVMDFLRVDGTLSVRNLRARNTITKEKSSLFSPEYIKETFSLVSDNILEPLHFSSMIVHGTTHVGRLNNIRIPEDLLTRTTKQVINDNFKIKSALTADVIVGETVNGYTLPNTTKFDKEHKIKIPAGIVADSSVDLRGEIRVKGKIGRRGLRFPHDLVFLNETAKISGEVKFVAPVIASSVKIANDRLNGMKLSVVQKKLDYYKLLFEKSKPEEVEGEGNTNNLQTLKNIYNHICFKTQTLEKSLRNTHCEPHSFSLLSYKDFDNVQKPTSNDYANFHIFKSVAGVKRNRTKIFSFEMDSSVWLIDSLHYGPCETRVFKWDSVFKEFLEQYTLNNIGNVHQWVEVYKDSEEIYLLSVASGGDECGPRGSTLWRFSYPFRKLEEVGSGLEAAIDAEVDHNHTSTFIYLDLGYKKVRYTFKNGYLEDEISRRSIPMARYLQKSSDNKLIVQVWEKDFLRILDSEWERVVMKPNTEDLILFTHQEETYFIICQMKNVLHQSYFVFEAYLYKNMNLFYLGNLDIGFPLNLVRLNFPEEASAFFLALYRNASPRIYKFGYGGMKLWDELPITLYEAPFAFSFHDEDGSLVVVFGDETKIVSTKINMNGEKYQKNIIVC